MKKIQFIILAAFISIFALSCSSKNMDESARKPAEPIGSGEEAATKPPVTEDTKTATNTPAVAEGTGSSVTESGKPTPDEATVNPGTPSPGGTSETVGGSTDVSITNAIRDKFAQSTLPSASRLKIEVRDAVVTLKGQASSKEEVNQILGLVREVPGIKSVVNQIQVANQ